MFAAERLERIKSIMLQRKVVNISTLTEILKVSDVTVRKDLDKLEKDQFLRKTHGGAVLIENQDLELGEQDPSELTIDHRVLKEQIAEIALTMVDEGDSIFVGGGTTCYLLCKKLKEAKNITIVSNNISGLNEAAPYFPNQYIVGGQMLYKNGFISTGGAKSLSYLEGIFVNKAFISVDGVALDVGYTTNEITQLDIFQQVHKIARQIIVMADYTKFNQFGIHRIASIEFADCVITNEKVDNKFKESLFKKNIKLLTSYNL